MNIFKNKTLLEEAGVLKNINASFVEKDWYAVQVLKKIHEFSYPGFEIIFTGGTALSKAYNIIQRFSEDIDFRVRSDIIWNRSKSQQNKNIIQF